MEQRSSFALSCPSCRKIVCESTTESYYVINYALINDCVKDDTSEPSVQENLCSKVSSCEKCLNKKATHVVFWEKGCGLLCEECSSTNPSAKTLSSKWTLQRYEFAKNVGNVGDETRTLNTVWSNSQYGIRSRIGCLKAQIASHSNISRASRTTICRKLDIVEERNVRIWRDNYNNAQLPRFRKIESIISDLTTTLHNISIPVFERMKVSILNELIELLAKLHLTKNPIVDTPIGFKILNGNTEFIFSQDPCAEMLE